MELQNTIMSVYHYVLLFCLVPSLNLATVLELSDRFNTARTQGLWLVEFYAPWCGHCKKLEVTWEKVGNAEQLASLGIRVARMDATRFPAVARELDVHGYPTIHFYSNGGKHTNYIGERNEEEIIDFAVRATGPAVRKLGSMRELETVKESTRVFFLYIGDDVKGEDIEMGKRGDKEKGKGEDKEKGKGDGKEEVNGEDEEMSLLTVYKEVAEKAMTLAYFYSIPSPATLNITSSLLPSSPTVRVYKKHHVLDFVVPATSTISSSTADEGDVVPDTSKPLNATLRRWVNKERFPIFPKVGPHGLYDVSHSGKLIILGVVQTVEGLFSSRKHEQFKRMMAGIADQRHMEFREGFQFAWTDDVDSAYSIVTSFIPLPNVLILKTDTYQYYYPDDEFDSGDGLTNEKLVHFINQVKEGEMKLRGGNSILMRIYRALWDLFAMIYTMFYSQPLIASLLFGLPISMLTFICCNICCAEGYDDEDDDDHEKND